MPALITTILLALITTILISLFWVTVFTMLRSLARRHCNAYSQCQTVVQEDGKSYDNWTFHASHDDSILGMTLGKFYIARAEAEFHRQQRKRKILTSN